MVFSIYKFLFSLVHSFGVVKTKYTETLGTEFGKSGSVPEIQLYSKQKEGTEFGIFLRSPIQTRETSTWDDDDSSAYFQTQRILKSKILSALNKHVVSNHEKWFKEDNFAGFNMRYLCSPVYFRREVRWFSLVIANPLLVKEVVTFGEIPLNNICSGKCYKEYAIILLGNGKVEKVSSKGSFRRGYVHNYSSGKIST